jgi:hypothetical protein
VIERYDRILRPQGCAAAMRIHERSRGVWSRQRHNLSGIAL